MKTVFIIIMVMGLFGSIVFFPVPIAKRSTCIADHHTLNTRLPYSDTPQRGPGPAHNRGRYLLQSYLQSWAFLWWTSLLITGISAYKLNTLKRGAQKP